MQTRDEFVSAKRASSGTRAGSPPCEFYFNENINLSSKLKAEVYRINYIEYM